MYKQKLCVYHIKCHVSGHYTLIAKYFYATIQTMVNIDLNLT